MLTTLILDNLRSAHNVGSILRTANAVGISRVICIGTTPYPTLPDDPRPGHVASRNSREIAKTALGAERSISLSYESDLRASLKALRAEGMIIAALELSPIAVDIFDYTAPPELALILGAEVEGISSPTLSECDVVLAIPMRGTKESLNVAVAAGIAMYQLTS